MDTIRIFVLETRTDLAEFAAAMKYVEESDESEKKPEWFKFNPEITDDDLESELSQLVDYEDDMISNYDSFIDRLRTDIRTQTQSFIEEESKLQEEFWTKEED